MPTQIENIRVYDIEEVGTVINKHPNTVRSYCKQGKIEAQKINDAWYVTQNNLEQVVKELNFPVSIIDHRLGIKSPKADSKLASKQ